MNAQKMVIICVNTINYSNFVFVCLTTEIFVSRYILYTKKGDIMEEKKFVSIDEMKDKLEEYGNKAIWKNIEGIGNWKDRVAYRQLFFLAEGNLDD
jgi:hypothetical protein